MSNRRVLVSFGDRNKVITLPESQGKPDLLLLEEEFRKVFEANSNGEFFFQKFEPDWSEYVDLEECTDIANKDKLKAILVVVNEEPCGPRGGQCSSLSVGSEAGLDFPVDESSSQSFTEQGQSSSAVELFSTNNESFVDQDDDINVDQELLSVIQSSSKRPRLDIYSSSDSEPDTTEDSNVHLATTSALPLVVKKETVKESPLPDPFPLPPNYRADVEIGLGSGMMSKEAKRHFFSSVAASMFKYKKKPTGEEYTRVAVQLITKYPFLKPPKSESPVKAIKETLRNRFKEFRRPPKSRTVPTTMARATQKQKSPSLNVDAIMNLPDVPPGEDATSFKRHNNLLISESKKNRANMFLVNECMEKSFEMRRRDLLSELYDINVVFEKYPFLRKPEQLYMDMQRILKLERLQNTVRNSWIASWTPQILKQAEVEKAGCKAVAITLEMLDNKSPISSLVILPYLLPDTKIKPNHEKIMLAIPESCDMLSTIRQKGQKEPYVLILGSFKEPKQTFLIIDGEVVAEINIQDIPLALLSSFFVFNICYTRGCANFYTFLEHALFSLSHKKLPPSINHFLAAIHVHI